jgi:hypothetical protein
MSVIRAMRALLVGAVLSFGGIACLSVATAADMPVKAPVPVVGASVPLDVHGFFDTTYATNRVTGGGLLLYPSGTALTQVSTGLGLDIYKDPAGFINLVNVHAGVWSEYWVNSLTNLGVRSWQEMDFWAGIDVVFAQYWKFTAEYVQFNFPGTIPTATNGVFTLGYSDAHLGWWFPFNPYVTLFYNSSEDGSTVVFGKRGGTYRVTIGIVPTVSLFKDHMFPLTLAFPTSVTVGPSTFWNRQDGTTNFCGPTGLAPCATSNLGFATTGIQAKWSLEKLIPKRLGSWYFKASGHYYHIYNDSLLAAQVGTPGVAPATSFINAKENVVVGALSLGFGF